MSAPLESREHERCERDLRARLGTEPRPADPDASPRLTQLASMFGLAPFEADIVAALWTTAHCPSWRAALAALDAFPGLLTVLGLTRAFGHTPRVRLPSDSPLRSWHIVTEHPVAEGTAAMSLDPLLIAWLNGDPELDRSLTRHVRLLAPAFELPSWRLDDQAEHLSERLLTGERLRIRICSDDSASVQACAAGLANRLGVLALFVDNDGGGSDEDHELAIRVQRQGFLDRCAPCWRASQASRAWPEEIPPFPVQFVLGDARLPPNARLQDVRITLEDPDVDERRALWLSALPAAAKWPAPALDDLALRFDASAGEIVQAASTQPRDATEASLRIREVTVSDLGELARPLPCPFTWNDLVVPDPVRDRLEEIAFEARERTRLWASPEAARLYPQGRGLVALLAGPPGTGKTMSAQVIAADLGLELLRVDISRVLSKWVGETAQHLQRILSSACSRRAVLLFDEADALFGKRIEDARQAQDHFVNMDISHLMIALESYTGIVLLATNLKSGLDAAFVRRIRHTIDFTTPDAKAREAIWIRVVCALFGDVAGATARGAVRRVAQIEATGAQIKNAGLSAAFAARRTRAPLTAELLGRMLARELAKDGAGMSSRELAATLEAS